MSSNFTTGFTPTRRIAVEITGNSAGLTRALGKADADLRKFSGKTNQIGQLARGGFAGSGLASKGSFLFGSASFIGASASTAIIASAIKATSELNEQVAATKVVFGDSAKAIEDWSKTTADAFGISRTQATAAAATFGALFKTGAQQTQRDAADMSKTIVELAGDLASFKNTTVDDALNALRSGLSGEIEPLRRYQVFLTAASVAQEAMAQTGKTNVQTLTQSEKIMARYALILRLTKDAQGDAARTASSLANQQRRLKAQTDDAAASLGRVLLPTATALVTALNDAFDAAGLLAGALKTLAGLPPIEIPVKFVFGGGRGQAILERVLLGGISPLGLGIKTATDLFGGGGGAAPAPDGRRPHGSGGRPGGGGGGGGGGARTQSLTREQELILARSRAELNASLANDIAAAKALVAFYTEKKGRLRNAPEKRFQAEQDLAAAQKDLYDLQTRAAEAATEQTKKNKSAIAAAAKRTQEALRKQAQAFKDQADAIKSAVLDAFDTKSQKIDNARALQDAKEALRIARQEGGPKGIKQALRELEDAKRAILRQRLENTAFRVTAGPAGPVNALQVGSVTIHINGAGDPDKIAQRVIRIIQRGGKQNASQQRGRNPGIAAHK